MKNRIAGRSAFLALLKDEGITHLFGNPGTTELPIMHALKDHPDLTYVMAMQESLVVAIEELQEWAYAGEKLVPLKGFPGIVWQRSKIRKRRERDGMF